MVMKDAYIDPQAVVNSLGKKVAELVIENCMLRVRITNLEAEFEKTEAADAQKSD